MFKFFLVKNFVDVWENIFHVILLNVLMIVFFLALTLSWFLQGFFNFSPLLTLAVYFAFVAVISGLTFTVFFAEGKNAASAVNAEGVSFSNFFKSIPSVFISGMKAGLVFTLAFAVVRYSLTYYAKSFASSGNFLFLLLAAFIFWFFIITLLSLQYLIPVMSLMNNSLFKALKKSYILFFDNTLFTVGLFILNIVSVILSIVTFGLAPGFCGIIFNSTNALKLRLYKYDWLEVNPTLSAKEKKDVPWSELLVKEKEVLGPHPIKNALMPWKQR